MRSISPVKELVLSSEDSADRLVGEDVHDRLGEQRRDAEHRHLRGLIARVDRHGVGDHDSLDVITLRDRRESVVGEERVRDEDVDLLRTVFHQRLRALDQRAARHRGVVADDRPLVTHPPRDAGHFDLLLRGPHLVDDREARVDHLGETNRLLGTSGIRRDRNNILSGEPEIAEMACKEL